MRGATGFVGLPTEEAQSAAAVGRSAVLGALLGALGVALWVQLQQQAVEQAQAAAAQAQAELARLQADQAQQAEHARQRQVAGVLLGRVQVAQQGRAQLLAVLEELARAPGPRLTLLRLDAQGLRIQGQSEAQALALWMPQRPAAALGLGPPQLAEFMSADGGQAARFAIHWPWPAGRTWP